MQNLSYCYGYEPSALACIYLWSFTFCIQDPECSFSNKSKITVRVLLHSKLLWFEFHSGPTKPFMVCFFHLPLPFCAFLLLSLRSIWPSGFVWPRWWFICLCLCNTEKAGVMVPCNTSPPLSYSLPSIHIPAGSWLALETPHPPLSL